MKIVETRVLRGPNLFARRPVIQAIVDLEQLDERPSSAIDGFTGRLLQMLPGIRSHCCGVGYEGGFVDRLHEGTYMAHVAEHLMLELQALAGDDIRYGHTRMLRDRPRHYRIVAGYAVEAVGLSALAQAVQVVEAAAEGRLLDIAALVDELRELRRRHGLGPSTQAIVDAARARGIPVLRLADETSLLQLGWGARQQRVQATVTGQSSHIAVAISCDKALTKQLLEGAGIPVPPGHIVTSADEAVAAAERLGWPVAVKPLDGQQGKGVTARVTAREALLAAFERAQRHGPRVLVERHVHGVDHRVLVVGDHVVAAARRLPPQVSGDGRRSVRALVDALNADPRRGVDHEAPLTRIPLDDAALACLAEQGLDADSVPPAGRVALLRANANLSTGGTAEDVTEQLHPHTARLCLRAAQRVGLDVAGIDLVCEDIAQPLAVQRGALIEVNAAPGLRMHEQPASGTARAAGRAIVDRLLPAGEDGRIPLVAVTGTNGKTTTVLAIEHVLRHLGHRTGCTTTQGVWIGGERVMDGDCTGYWSGLAVLTDPQVDVAVLETARGGILKRGLCFDRCDVAVVLNVSTDHLGQDGIGSVVEMARVKAVVADSARRAAVLNAEDAHCMTMAAELREGVEAILFSMDPQHPALQAHLRRGGRAVLLREGEVVLEGPQGARAVVRADRLPFTLEGRARHNVANALAAVAALLALQLPAAAIGPALCGFGCSVERNPLRMNLFQLDELRLVVDYAHNEAAYRALLDTCRAFSGGGRLVGVVSAPGDRRDEELHHLGALCAEGFDELVIFELDEDRGRPRGETALVLAAGAAAAGAAPEVHVEVATALRAGRRRCRPGDTLVYACAVDLQDLRAAFGEDMLIAEERWAPALRLAWSADDDARAAAGGSGRRQEQA